ncbi:MAG: SUMF1/EgtB/PvdO family nonheme iron enzyme [bacterium]|nr:SUMF1/EgtB/PvdO family nonheme iron enzyme [bacterium]
MRIFISYSRVDRNLCVDLASRLRRVYGYESTWFDETLHAGEVWWQEILDQVRRCDIFLIMMTRETFESEYCQAELKEARRLNKALLPVLVRARTEIPDHLKHIQYVDMGQGINADNIAELYAAIEQIQKRLKPQAADPLSPDPTPKPAVAAVGRTEELKRVKTISRGAFIFGAVGFVAFAAMLILLVGAMNAQGSGGGVSANLQTQLAAANFTDVAAVVTNLAAATETPTETATATPTLTDSPVPTATATSTFTDTPTATVTTTPSITPSPDLTQALATFDAQLTGTFVAALTGTAALWTATPTLDFTQTIQAVVAQRTAQNQTQIAANATATATLWTATPTATFTASPTATATPTATLAPRQAAEQLALQGVDRNGEWTPYVDIVGGSLMALVPRGCFMMGSQSGAADEAPVHEQCIEEAFWIDVTEATNAQFSYPGTFPGRSRPRELLLWEEARDHCIDRDAALPTEAQWEFAARGPSGWEYPWGNELIPDNALYAGNANVAGTQDVGLRSAGVSWVGALDMAGNVAEWVSSRYSAYPYVADDGRETAFGGERIARGGSWRTEGIDIRATARRPYTANTTRNDVGFRCVKPFIASES